MATKKRRSRSSRRSSRSSRGRHGNAGTGRARSRVEAREWLRGKVESFASNHFDGDVDSRGGFRDFVNALYRAGAKEVLVENPYNEAWREASYADTLRVVLPSDRAKSVKVMERIAKEHPDEVDVEASGVRVWWD
jgi:hypothetical protein